MAKTLPDDNYLRRLAGFAEQELARGNIRTALQYVVDDNPDPTPWNNIEWIARAGRFDRAIELAGQGSSPVQRLGGMLAVATHMLDGNDTARATKIVEDVERELPSIPTNGIDQEPALIRNVAAEIWVRLGQTERAARLIGNSGGSSVSALLAIAGKYPAAASLREQAWHDAERVNEPWVWQLLLKDAMSRGDKAEATRAAQRAVQRMDAEIDRHAASAISLARVLLEAELPDLSARLVKQWTRWVKGEEATKQFNTVNALIPVLVGLALDQDVESAANAVSDASYRSQCLSKAAEEYFRIGRNDAARKFDAEALRVATSSPTGEPKPQAEHESALHNLALARADHGDIQGALDVAAQLHDDTRIRDVTSSIVRRAIDNGHGPVAGPAIQAMEQQASAAQDGSLLLQAANYWQEVGKQEDARRSLAQALKTAEERQSPLAAVDAAELMWRINGNAKAQAMLEIVDRFKVSDSGAIHRLVEIMSPVSPAVAVQLSDRQREVESRILELANIAVQIAQANK